MPKSESVLDPEAVAFYAHTLKVVQAAGVRCLVGGACAFACYTGIARNTKDLDIFVKAEDLDAVLAALEQDGYRTEVPFPHWLGKAYLGDYFVDAIFSSGNGLARVDEAWFVHSRPHEVMGVSVRLCPPEEMIWSKSFIQERERFDGADIAHLVRARGRQLDWERLLRRFGPNWRVLLGHLVLFGYIYPSERDCVPSWIMHELLRRVHNELSAPPPRERLCRGTLLSRQQYLIDVTEWGYADPRAGPDNPMTGEQIATWTAGIADDGAP